MGGKGEGSTYLHHERKIHKEAAEHMGGNWRSQAAQQYSGHSPYNLQRHMQGAEEGPGAGTSGGFAEDTPHPCALQSPGPWAEEGGWQRDGEPGSWAAGVGVRDLGDFAVGNPSATCH
eukprot:EG_transcript_34403